MAIPGHKCTQMCFTKMIHTCIPLHTATSVATIPKAQTPLFHWAHLASVQGRAIYRPPSSCEISIR